MAQMTEGYATSAYVAAQIQAMSPVQVMMQLYDFAVAACVAGDSRKASAALVELIAALDFNYEDIATGLYRLYEYCLREVKAERFESPHKILSDLRDTWHVALGIAGSENRG